MTLNEQLKNKRVLVIGDSFTDISGTHYAWLNRLRVHFNWKITNKSIAGSGSHYAFHTFMNNNDDFDICIFGWSEPTRLFHESVPHLNSNEAKRQSHMQGWQKDIYRAAQHYYMHLVNDEMERYKNTALLYWLDDYLEKHYADKYFIHFHCFPDHSWHHQSVYETIRNIEEPKFYHTFKNGINVSPTLLKLSSLDPEQPDNYGNDTRTGHLSKSMHDKVFYGITNYFKKHAYNNDNNVINII